MLLFWLTLMALGNKGEVALYGYVPITGHFWADMCAGAMLVRTCVSAPRSCSCFAPRSCWVFNCLVGGLLQLNVGLFLFNLCIPAYPLDGGRIFIDTLLIWEARSCMALSVSELLFYRRDSSHGFPHPHPHRHAAFHTSQVSMDNTASACVVVNAIFGVLLLIYGITSFPGGFITILIAGYILWQAYRLVKHQSDGTLAQHELFQNAANAPTAPVPNYSTTVTNPIASV